MSPSDAAMPRRLPHSEVKEHDGVRNHQATCPDPGARPDRSGRPAGRGLHAGRVDGPVGGGADRGAASAGAASRTAASADPMADCSSPRPRPRATLTTIALPHDWCNYGEVIDSFKAKYGIEVNELDPLAGSGDEIEAIKANVGNPGPQAPDVVDVGFAFGEANKDLFQPYKVSTWDTIPESAKAADGSWYGDYYGVMSFVTNTEAVPNPPKDWADLLKPEYKNQVALDGDPRTSNQAIQAVYASALANGGTLDNAQAGPRLLGQDRQGRQLRAGRRQPGDDRQRRHADHAPAGPTTDCASRDKQPADRRDRPGQRPLRRRLRPGHQQAAPHPNAAKLWMEYLYSDEGQLL